MWWLCIFLSHLSWSYAGLGDPQISVEIDRNYFHAEQKCFQNSDWTSCELRTPQGVIQEYVDLASQIVFAITWNGERQPDLKVLLGEYAEGILEQLALPAKFLWRRDHHVETTDVAFVRGGRFHKSHGRAYLIAFRKKYPSLEKMIH